MKGRRSVILSPDRRFLFATNGGTIRFDFTVGDHGKLTLIDTKPTGNAIDGKSGTAKSLAYSPSKDMLYVVHSFGPDHIRIMSVSGNEARRAWNDTCNTPDKPHRVPTHAVISPDGSLVGEAFDIAHRNLRRFIPTVRQSFGCPGQTAS